MKTHEERKRERAKRRLGPRKPTWLKGITLPGGEVYTEVRQNLRERNLYTVCEEARCPNLGQCWGGGTATFMVLGDVCTRGCRFCAIKTSKHGIPVDLDEPRKVAESAMLMGINYAVITSVDRDDLPDGGASHFADVICAVRENSNNSIRVEVLTSDFQGDLDCVQAIAEAKPTVFAHNVETVERLQKKVRDPRCAYDQSMRVLQAMKEFDPSAVTKTSLMLGLGESKDEILQTMDDLRAIDVDILTLGQYMQPSRKHIPVVEYLHPDQFAALAEEGLKRGFTFVPSGPMVRSSYRAGEFYDEHFNTHPLYQKPVAARVHSLDAVKSALHIPSV